MGSPPTARKTGAPPSASAQLSSPVLCAPRGSDEDRISSPRALKRRVPTRYKDPNIRAGPAARKLPGRSQPEVTTQRRASIRSCRLAWQASEDDGTPAVFRRKFRPTGRRAHEVGNSCRRDPGEAKRTAWT